MRLNNPAFVFAVVLTALVGVASVADAGQRYKWWESGDVRTELDITDEQAAAIDEIYTEALPVLKSLGDALDAEEKELSHIIADMNVAEWQLTLQIDKTEAARSALSKKRLLMIYHMRQELTPEQRTGLRELRDRRRQERRSSDSR